MATTREDIIKDLYRHLSKCEQCHPRDSAPVPNVLKCKTGQRLAQVFTIR